MTKLMLHTAVLRRGWNEAPTVDSISTSTLPVEQAIARYANMQRRDIKEYLRTAYTLPIMSKRSGIAHVSIVLALSTPEATLGPLCDGPYFLPHTYRL